MFNYIIDTITRNEVHIIHAAEKLREEEKARQQAEKEAQREDRKVGVAIVS